MKIELTCPECDARYRVSLDYAGKKIRCKTCDATLQVPDSQADSAEFEEKLWSSPVTSSSRNREEFSGLPPKLPKKKKRAPKEEDAESSLLEHTVSQQVVNRLIFLLACAAVLIVLTVAGLYNPAAFLWGGIALLVVGNLATYLHACENECGLLYRLVPLYSIYYTLCNFSELWHWGVIRLGGGGLLLTGIFTYAFQSRQADLLVEQRQQQFLLTISVESLELPEDVIIDPEERYHDFFQPTPEAVRKEISSLPWENRNLVCSVTMRPPLTTGEDYEFLILEGTPNSLRPGEPLVLTWEKTEPQGGHNKTSTPYKSLDEVWPVLDAFFSANTEWHALVTWRDPYSERFFE